MRGRLLYLLALVGFLAAVSPAWMFRNFATAFGNGQPVQYSGTGALINLIYIVIVAVVVGAILVFLVWNLYKKQQEIGDLKDELDRLKLRSDMHRKYPDGLTQREVEVLRLVAQGKSNQEIANDLKIVQDTAARHLSNIFNKIGSQNRAEAAVYAANNDLLE